MPSMTRSMYDSTNVFARILRGEIPATKIHETQRTLVIQDIFPQAPVHLLVLPKGAYTCFDDFMARASQEELIDLFSVVREVTRSKQLENTGYRIISNKGPEAGQEVPHFHIHILAGKKLGPLLGKDPSKEG